MHTDKFEISLHRELKVCGNTIQRIRKTLELMEQKYHKTTEAFIEEYKNGNLDSDLNNKDNYRTWEISYESLKQRQGPGPAIPGTIPDHENLNLLFASCLFMLYFSACNEQLPILHSRAKTTAS